MCCFTHIISELGKLKQEDCHEFKTSLSYIVSFSTVYAIVCVSLCFKMNKNKIVRQAPNHYMFHTQSQHFYFILNFYSFYILITVPTPSPSLTPPPHPHPLHIILFFSTNDTIFYALSYIILLIYFNYYSIVVKRKFQLLLLNNNECHSQAKPSHS